MSKKPVIVVTFKYVRPFLTNKIAKHCHSFRIGLLGFAASNMIRDDNKLAGEEGCGNYGMRSSFSSICAPLTLSSFPGLRDQRKVMEWLHTHIPLFGGDPRNITLLGIGTGAADVVCHLLSRHNSISNQTHPRLFARAVIQSPIFEPILPDVASAGWMLSRVMSALQVCSIEGFRKMEVAKLLGLAQNLRVVDDGVWFRKGWDRWFMTEKERGRQHHCHRGYHESDRYLSRQVKSGLSGGMGVCSSGVSLLASTTAMLGVRVGNGRSKSRSKSRSRAKSSARSPASSHCQPTSPSGSHSPRSTPLVLAPTCPTDTPRSSESNVDPTPLQPIIIGDSASDSLLWSIPISLWTSAGVVRRLKALCQSLSKTTGILRAYDFGSHTPDEEIIERVLELVDDARVAWPTDMLAEAMLREGNSKVWRYVFDQEGPGRGIPHHGADLMYLFDWKPTSLGLGSLLDQSPNSSTDSAEVEAQVFWDGPFDVDEDEEEKEKPIVSHNPPSLGSLSFEAALAAAAEAAVAMAAASAPKIDPHVLASSIVSSSSISSSSSDTSSRSTEDTDWLISSVDRFAYVRIRDTMQDKWIAFAHGEEPWTPWTGRTGLSHHHLTEPHTPTPTTPTPFNLHPTLTKPEKVFIFGPEGETGERGSAIFDGRRRRTMWREVHESLGWTLVQKLGVELSRGPALGADRVR